MKKLNYPFTKQGIENAIKIIYGDQIIVEMEKLQLIKEYENLKSGYAKSIYRFSNKYYQYDIMIETEDIENIPIKIKYVKKRNNY